MSPDELLFDGEFLKKLEYLHVVSKKVFAGHFRAERRSRKRGSGIEFADHRAYAPGDDFRHVDWRAYQRLDKLLLRLFEEEQDLPIYIFVDTSRSMLQGRPRKLRYAKQVAAALCYIGLAHLDRVALLSYADGLGRELEPQRGKRQIFKVFNFLRHLEPGGPTNAQDAFTTFCTSRKAHGVTVVISDLLDPMGFEAGLNVLRYYRHEIFAIHVTGPSDTAPPLDGELRLVDAEDGDTCDLFLTPALVAAYRDTFDRWCGEIAAYCARYHVGYIRTFTDVPFEDAVLRIFRRGGFVA